MKIRSKLLPVTLSAATLIIIVVLLFGKQMVAEVNYKIGKSHLKKGGDVMTDSVKKRFSNSYNLVPTNSRYRFWYTFAKGEEIWPLLKNGDYVQTIKTLNECIEIVPNYYNFYLMLSIAEERCGNLTQAIGLMHKSISSYDSVPINEAYENWDFNLYIDRNELVARLCELERKTTVGN